MTAFSWRYCLATFVLVTLVALLLLTVAGLVLGDRWSIMGLLTICEGV